MKGAFANTCVAQGKCILKPRVRHSARKPILKISEKDIGQPRETSVWLHAEICKAPLTSPLTIWLNAEHCMQLISSGSCGPDQYPPLCQCPSSCPCPYPCPCSYSFPYPCPCPCPLLRSSSSSRRCLQRLELPNHRCRQPAPPSRPARVPSDDADLGGPANPLHAHPLEDGASIRTRFSECPKVTVHIH